MAKGRKAKPTHLKVVTGNPGKRPLKEDLLPPVEIPSAPACLSRDAADIWLTTTMELAKLGIIARIDVHQIAAYCNIVSRMQKAQAVLDEHDLIYETHSEKTGTMFRVRPELKIIQDCEKLLARYAAEFGMTAASRTKLKGDPRQPELPLDDPTADAY